MYEFMRSVFAIARTAYLNKRIWSLQIKYQANYR